jgi:polyhydroxyalkanoate synthesis regulator phasin
MTDEKQAALERIQNTFNSFLDDGKTPVERARIVVDDFKGLSEERRNEYIAKGFFNSAIIAMRQNIAVLTSDIQAFEGLIEELKQCI